ncbi:MAG: cytochrome c/FTR1 family iron permease [Salibacteraceae bacterium]
MFSYAQEKIHEDNARMLINLMDYIAKDYGMGVENGVVINEFEYAEMHEFIGTAKTKLDDLIDANAVESPVGLSEELDPLASLIADTASSSVVSNQAEKVKAMALKVGLVALSPSKWPNLEKGKSLFAQECASCHGTYGEGDGPAGINLTPAPTNFRDHGIMVGVGPFQAYNTIRLGIPGTGMRAFTELSDDDIWDLAFYITSLQHLGSRNAQPSMEITLEELAALSDEELLQQYPSINLAAQRSNPVEIDKKKGQKSPLIIAREKLQNAERLFADGNKKAALNASLNAYLEGIEPIEAQVQASDNKLFGELEKAMMDVRTAINSEVSEEELKVKLDAAFSTIERAEALISTSKRGILDTTIISASILLREGLEAFFVILAILGVLKKVNIPSASRWVHAGWITAVLIGMSGWFFTDLLFSWSAASRELMEGLVGLFAVGILLYIGYWLHGKTEASKWKAFVESKIKTLANKNNMIGLGVFAFIVVFREAFESVLFLSSLSAGAEEGAKIGILLGFIASALLLLIFGIVMLRWFKKLPIAKVFMFSTIMILVLAVILAGQGIHALQEGGFLGINAFPVNIRVSLLGIYPTMETMLTQLGVIGLIALLWKLSNRSAAKTAYGN